MVGPNLRDMLNKPLVEGGRPPITDFRARLVKLIVAPQENYPNRYNVLVQTSEVQVLASEAPWLNSTFEFRIPFSDKKGTRWSIFKESAEKFLTRDADGKVDIYELEDKICRFTYTPNHPLFDGRANEGKGARVPQEAWEVTEVEGAEAAQPASVNGSANSSTPKVSPSLIRALELLDGKKEQEFGSQALRDDVVKRDQELIVDIAVNRKFLPAVLDKGFATKDEDGVYHVLPAVLTALRG